MLFEPGVGLCIHQRRLQPSTLPAEHRQEGCSWWTAIMLVGTLILTKPLTLMNASAETKGKTLEQIEALFYDDGKAL